jgi:hypothetical protein
MGGQFSLYFVESRSCAEPVFDTKPFVVQAEFFCEGAMGFGGTALILLISLSA